MTELLSGTVEVRTEDADIPVAVRVDGVWRNVVDIALTWRVETDWWRAAARRDYTRCLLANGECIEIYRDLDAGEWFWLRRYD